MSLLRIAVLLLPWLELFTLIELGIETSALTALAYVLVTVIIGLAILQRQGKGMFERLREAQGGRVIGPDLLLDDMAMGLAGLLLMFPGMISDFVALIMMVGPLRRRVARALLGSHPAAFSQMRNREGSETIEGDFRRVDDDENR
jgi:UPF0716 protein FxsA